MCGLYGALSVSGRPIPASVTAAMSAQVARRGPDDVGQWSDGIIVLGHRRLAVIDLSALAHQPMHDLNARYTIVFNGTIYNYPELRQDLIARGLRFQSHSDTEVILNAYIRWGAKCTEKLQGAFAFAIWDRRQRSLFMARDRLGIKPLYYAQTNGSFYFASNPQALIATGACDTRIDPVGLHHQLTLHGVVPAPQTLLRGVRKCRPGYQMSIQADGRIDEYQYWFLEARRPSLVRSTAEWHADIHAALCEAVKRRIDIADVPVGVLLSGGLDSSLLVALMAESGISQIKTFSIGFEDQAEEKGNEFEFSDAVAKQYATDHHQFLIPNHDVLRRLPEAVNAMAEPMVGQDAVAFYLLSEQVAKVVKVVQSGQGADEVFAGYFWYARMLAETGSPLERFARHYTDRDHDAFCAEVMPSFQGADHSSALIAEQLDTQHADTFMDAVLRFDVTTLIVDDPVKRVDNMTMAWGLEARVPFLDQHLVELVASCPVELKMQNQGKGVLKAIARGRIPDAVIDRPKGYFPMPALKYVRGDFYQLMADILTSQCSRERGIFRPEYIDELLKNPQQHFSRLNGSKLWHSALLELWLQQHL